MKEKNYIYTVETDVNSIELNLTNASVEICEAADDKFYIEYPNTKNIFAANNENGIFIHQGKCGIFIKPHQLIKIFVPAHTVPSLKIYGKSVEVLVKNGIYGEFRLSAEEGNAALYDCALESAQLNGGNLSAYLSGVTMKDALVFQTEKGDLLAENSFAPRAEIRVKRGNIGVVNVNCKDCSFDTQKGNITASLSGDEGNYNTSLITREGTVNRENVQRENAEGSFYAYSKKGNIVLDFTGGQTGAEIEIPSAGENAVKGVEKDEEKEKENA